MTVGGRSKTYIFFCATNWNCKNSHATRIESASGFIWFLLSSQAWSLLVPVKSVFGYVAISRGLSHPSETHVIFGHKSGDPRVPSCWWAGKTWWVFSHLGWMETETSTFSQPKPLATAAKKSLNLWTKTWVSSFYLDFIGGWIKKGEDISIYQIVTKLTIYHGISGQSNLKQIQVYTW